MNPYKIRSFSNRLYSFSESIGNVIRSGRLYNEDRKQYIFTDHCEVHAMKEPVRYGILSTASIVPRFVRGLNLTSSGKAVAIASRSLEKAEKMAELLDIPEYYDDYEKVLNHPGINAVYIPLINSLHYEYAKKALLAGKHVIMEKPFVLHAEEAKELAEIAAAKHLFITEAVKTPFLPVYRRIREIIEEKTYGDIHFMEFKQSYTSGPYITGWNTQKESGGGVLYANEAYFFHMAEFLGGKIVSVRGQASYGDTDAENQCTVAAKLKNNILATLSVSTKVLFRNGLIIYFDNAVIDIPDFWKASAAYIHQNGQLIETIRGNAEYEFQYELAHYHECIHNGLSFSPVTPISNTERYIAFCEKLYRSFGK